MPYYIADTETTGLAFGSQIIELAWIEISEDLTEISRFEQRYKPSVPITAEASAQHGIILEDLVDCPPVKEIPNLLDVTLIAHNAVFDRRMLETYWDIDNILCTCRSAQQLYPDAPSHKLQTLKYHLSFTKDRDRNAHAAMSDVLDVLDLLRMMISDSGLALSEFIAECNKPVKHEIMTFGKHKGAMVKHLPQSYKEWLVSDAFEDPWGDWELSLRGLV